MSISVLEPRLLIGNARRTIPGLIPASCGAATICSSDDSDDSDDESEEEEEEEVDDGVGYPHQLPGLGY